MSQKNNFEFSSPKKKPFSKQFLKEPFFSQLQEHFNNLKNIFSTIKNLQCNGKVASILEANKEPLILRVCILSQIKYYICIEPVHVNILNTASSYQAQVYLFNCETAQSHPPNAALLKLKNAALPHPCNYQIYLRLTYAATQKMLFNLQVFQSDVCFLIGSLAIIRPDLSAYLTDRTVLQTNRQTRVARVCAFLRP